MAGLFGFLEGDPRYQKKWGQGGKPFAQPPSEVIWHDRGGTYQGSSPYHLEVLPDGQIMNHWPDTTAAPHAYKSNPYSIGVSYGGQVGATPTPQALESLKFIKQGLSSANPNLKFQSHGEAFNATRGTSHQASKLGRGLDEASWRTLLDDPAAPPILQTGYGRQAPGEPVPVGQRSFVQASGLRPADTQELPQVAGWSQTQDAPQMADKGYFGNLQGNPLFLAGLSILGDPERNVGRGLSSGFGAASSAQDNDIKRQRMAQLAQEQQREVAMREQFGSLVSEGLPGIDPQMARLAQTMGPERGGAFLVDLIQKQKAASEANFSLQPQYGVDAQGNPVMLQLNSRGGAQPVQLPPGVSLSAKPIKMDAGTHYVMIDPITRQTVGTIPKDLSGAEQAKAVGEARGKSIAAAPSDIQASNNALDLLASIRNDPGIDTGTGFSSLGNVIPGTPGFDFSTKVEQAKSGAFLSAIQQLRGMGALSNAEGQTATSAVTRMTTAQSKEAFLSAADDYEKIIRQGEAKAQNLLSTATVPAAPVSGAGRKRYNPATGELE